MSTIPVLKNIFKNLSFVLEKLSNQEYAQSLPLLSGGSVGQHMRHTLEFFICLMNGIPEGRIDYDQRKRDIFLESNALEAQACLNKLITQLEQVDVQQPIVLIQNYGSNPSDQLEVMSNIERELVYNIEHAIHHMAIMRIAVKLIQPDLKLPKDFGLASATLLYRKKQKISI